MYHAPFVAWLTLFVIIALSTAPGSAGSVEGLLSSALKGASSRHYVFGDDSSYEPGDYYLTMRQAMPMPPGPSNELRPSGTTSAPSGTALPSPSVTPVHPVTPSPHCLEERTRCENLLRRRNEEFTMPHVQLKKTMKRLVRMVAKATSSIDKAILQARLDSLRADEAVLLVRGEKLMQMLERDMCFMKVSASPSSMMPSATPSRSRSPSSATRECSILWRKLQVNLRRLTVVKRKMSQIRLKLSKSTLSGEERLTLRPKLADLRLEEFEFIVERAILLEKVSMAGC